MDPVWAIMPTKSRVNPIPYSVLTFYVTEDALGFIIKGERDHMGPLASGNMPIINARFLTKFIFHVSTVTPFYILHNNGDIIPDSQVKNQGITNGMLIWNNTERPYDCFYGNPTKVGAYKNMIKKVFGPY